ncbi:proteasome assembly chaperone 3-like [Megalopta genalis]|uniref:proteasome assembly chaperone 3-like n=1 Tax=Megalopta genalis TaxID=115081 RepID=UPI003FD34CB4
MSSNDLTLYVVQTNISNNVCSKDLKIFYLSATDGGVTNFCNRILLIVTHFKKFGSLVSVTRGPLIHQLTNSVFSTKVLFGKDDIEVVAAARFIAEQINADKPLLLSISLKSYDPDTIKAIASTVNEMKVW